MIENILYLLTACFGFITIFIIGFRFKTNRHTNFYLLLIFLLNSIRFLFHSLSDHPFIVSYTRPIDLIIFAFASPLSYLYFKNLVRNDKNFRGKDLLHCILPLLLLFFINYYATHFTEIKELKVRLFILMVFNLGYAIASYILLKNSVWKRDSNILIINQQNKIIKKWSKILFGFFILIIIRFLANLAFNTNEYWYTNNTNFLWLTSLIWIYLYFQILYSPEFLYGYEVFENKIKEFKKHTILFDNIWIIETSKPVTNIQDSILKDKIRPNLENYILEIENLALNTPLFFSETLKKINLSNKLNIPNSHVFFVFKYHSTISFSDFKKIIRIQKSIALIEKGFLKHSTFSSLAIETGFSSYSSFFKSFKNSIGVSPQEYYQNTNPK